MISRQNCSGDEQADVKFEFGLSKRNGLNLVGSESRGAVRPAVRVVLRLLQSLPRARIAAPPAVCRSPTGSKLKRSRMTRRGSGCGDTALIRMSGRKQKAEADTFLLPCSSLAHSKLQVVCLASHTLNINGPFRIKSRTCFSSVLPSIPPYFCGVFLWRNQVE